MACCVIQNKLQRLLWNYNMMLHHQLLLLPLLNVFLLDFSFN